MIPMQTVRTALGLALSLALLSTAGCGWFRASTGYDRSPESRPLEVPPDLDAPVVDTSMSVPAAPASAGSDAPVTGQSFLIADSADGAWRRLGLALDRIQGVTVSERAQVLGVYNVSYEGESFLVRVSAEGETARVSAVSPDGRELTSGAAGRLLGLLRTRLG